MCVLSRTTSLFFAALVATGCASYPPEIPSYKDATAHYQSSERFGQVTLQVTHADTRYASLAVATSEAAAHYLEQNDITVVPASVANAGNAAALRIRITNQGDDHLLTAELLAPDGRQVEITPLFLASPGLQGPALAQHLATLIVDDMMLLWYPAKGGSASKASEAKFALLANDIPRQSIDGESTFSWEEFPSKRLLSRSSLAASDIDNVTYELRIHKAGRMMVFHRYQRTFVYLKTGITGALYTLPFSLPSCEKVVWSVRARFKLAGHMRVTEWSGHASTYYNNVGPWPVLPPYLHRRNSGQETWSQAYKSFPLEHHVGGGSVDKVIPPDEVKCGELQRGIFNDDSKLATVDFEEPLNPLLPGEAIAVSSTTERVCNTPRCEIYPGTIDSTPMMSACLAREFKRRSLNIPIVSRDEADTENVRYVLSSKISIREGDTTFGGEAGVFSEASRTTKYSAALATEVFDGGSGELLGRFGAGDQGQKSKSVAFFLIIPVMYLPISTIGDMEKNSCDEVARRLSFMLRGGVSTGWPSDYFKPIGSPLWET